ncbi:Uma2 family endonuclease [Sorangium sp. So ce1014]|uniref:Uma2 family endonuclease n=1 Tax=Sorangium sp. So ce1014 TaxID=3133326 RepID=UPI003F607B8A
MVAAAHMPSRSSIAPAGEQRFVIYGVPWQTYVRLRDELDTPGLRMTFCEGTLELMRPSIDHEATKKSIARLIEIFALERDVPLHGYGSTTFRREAKARGLEPDECYCVGEPLKEFPDIAIEVVLTSGGLDKLSVYSGLGVREVWFWERDAFQLHALRGEAYEAIATSELLPDLDLAALARFVRWPDQHAAVKAFRSWLRDGG